MKLFFPVVFLSFLASGAFSHDAHFPSDLSDDETIASGSATELTPNDVAEIEALIESEAEEEDSLFVEKGWPKLELKWKTSSIPVCWENATEENMSNRLIIQKAVTDTWQAHSGVKFAGWENCVPGNRGIRILISDEGPHTKGLGTQLDGRKNSMVLNATYNNWSKNCKRNKDYCSYVIAVHEFGHALGFAHDQNRPDTPESCNKRQGSDGSSETLSWTPWDKHSVMNYCNPIWSNGGRLSKLDVYLVQRLYGKP